MNNNKFFIIKGLWLGIVLVVIHKIFAMFSLNINNNDLYYYFIGAIFGLVVLLFLTTKKIGNLLITGFVGLFVLIGTEILLAMTGLGDAIIEFLTGYSFFYKWIEVYFSGFLGSMLGTGIAFILTLIGVNFKILTKNEELFMENSIKLKISIYMIISALGFSYLIMPQNSSVGVVVFAIIQFVFLWFVVPNRKKLWFFIPIFILSLNSFISGYAIWKVPNFIVSIVLYSVMFMDFNMKDTSLIFLKDIIKNIIDPIKHSELPFTWAMNANKVKAPIIKRIVIALSITIPSIIILIALLSSADMVFYKGTTDFLSNILKYINFNVIFKGICGFIVGIYLFDVIYSAYFKQVKENIKFNTKDGDLIIINILLISILAIYTIFVLIQFKYLFAGETLPYGLTYTEYARKGFFELFFLTGINISIILVTVYLTKNLHGLWSKITNLLCCYLCVITIILLSSSFYRMWLYNVDDGLTRLRFLVFGFLLFEAIGLVITFFYILKPKFNIVVVYLSIALLYYLLLNVVPMDYFVAKSQIDRCLKGDNGGISYTMTLSTDAAVQIERLLDSNSQVNEIIKNQAGYYFENQNQYYKSFIPRWQRYNLSVSKMHKIYKKISSNPINTNTF